MPKISDIIRSEFEKSAQQKGQKADLRYLNSAKVLEITKEITGRDTIFAVKNVDDLRKIQEAYQKTLEHKNTHGSCSAAILHYMTFVSLNIK